MAGQFDLVLEGIEFCEEFDFYVYCFSYECSSEVLDSFCPGPPFDRVARIVDIGELAKAISSFHPQLRGYDYVISPTVYTNNRKRDLHEPNPPYITQAFEKPLEFAGNKEGRIVFFRKEDEPINVLPPLPDFPYPAIRKRLIIPGEMPQRSMARPNELLAEP